MALVKKEYSPLLRFRRGGSRSAPVACKPCFAIAFAGIFLCVRDMTGPTFYFTQLYVIAIHRSRRPGGKITSSEDVEW